MKRIAALTLIVTCIAFGQDAPRRSRPGRFEYYVMSLSWSPQYCSEQPGDRQQCGAGKRYGFVLHGLWPQHERGYPAFCGAREQVTPGVASEVLPIMPSTRLIQHQWEKHGTCSGLQQDEYFQAALEAFRSIRIPPQFERAARAFSAAPYQLKEAFVKANPQLPLAALRVRCRGRYLDEVRVCLSKDLKYRSCEEDLKDGCPGSLLVRPLR
jgi:ribonuclease T2